jgi:N-acetylglucosamine-6-sulfatase
VGGGGFASFDDDPAVHPTIATDLRSMGYRTALIGKYLNGYPGADTWTYVPPGWDRWFAIPDRAYYGYDAASNGRRRHFGHDPEDYSTTVLRERAERFISSSQALGTPFFLYVATTAPHKPAIPMPVDVGRFEGDVDLYHWPASVGEADVSDKPTYIQARPWSHTIQRGYDALHARQLNSIYGVDRAFARIWDALPGNTIVLFMSDNGVLWGEHRWSGKLVPYEESIRVPMIIATKGLGLPDVEPDRIALNVDIRATLESYAGLAPMTMGSAWTDPIWTRGSFVLEHWSQAVVPTYCGVRSRDWMYVRYATGEEELYDVALDPLELTNVVPTDPPELATLRARAGTLCTRGTIYPPDWPF